MVQILTHPSSVAPQGTTNQTIAQDLRASLTARRGVFVGASPSVGEFILALRALGLTDDMSLGMVEFGCAQSGTGVLTIDTGEYGIEIREGR